MKGITSTFLLALVASHATARSLQPRSGKCKFVSEYPECDCKVPLNIVEIGEAAPYGNVPAPDCPGSMKDPPPAKPTKPKYKDILPHQCTARYPDETAGDWHVPPEKGHYTFNLPKIEEWDTQCKYACINLNKGADTPKNLPDAYCDYHPSTKWPFPDGSYYQKRFGWKIYIGDCQCNDATPYEIVGWVATLVLQTMKDAMKIVESVWKTAIEMALTMVVLPTGIGGAASAAVIGAIEIGVNAAKVAEFAYGVGRGFKVFYNWAKYRGTIGKDGMEATYNAFRKDPRSFKPPRGLQRNSGKDGDEALPKNWDKGGNRIPRPKPKDGKPKPPKKCPPGFKGKDCKDKCKPDEDCYKRKDHDKCDPPKTGKNCDECIPGRKGKDCKDKCPEGMIGKNCKEKDKCKNRDKMTGKCHDKCKPPRTKNENGDCEDPPKCPKAEQYNPKTKKCEKDDKDDHGCKKRGAQWNTKTKQCDKRCKKNEVWNEKKQKCQKKPRQCRKKPKQKPLGGKGGKSGRGTTP